MQSTCSLRAVCTHLVDILIPLVCRIDHVAVQTLGEGASGHGGAHEEDAARLARGRVRVRVRLRARLRVRVKVRVRIRVRVSLEPPGTGRRSAWPWSSAAPATAACT